MFLVRPRDPPHGRTMQTLRMELEIDRHPSSNLPPKSSPKRMTTKKWRLGALGGLLFSGPTLKILALTAQIRHK